MYANTTNKQQFAHPSVEFEISFKVYLIIIKIKKNLEYLHELLLDASEINVPNIPLIIREQLITEILETQRTILQEFKRTFCCPEPISEIIDELVAFFDGNLKTSVHEEEDGEENHGRYVYEHTVVSEYQFSCLKKFRESIEQFIECENNHKLYKRIIAGEEDLEDLKLQLYNPDIMEYSDRSTVRSRSSLLEIDWKDNSYVNELFLEKLKLPLNEIPFGMKQLLWDVVAVMKIGYKKSKQLKTPKTLFLIQTVLDVLQTLSGHFLEPLLYLKDKEFEVLHKALTTKVFIRSFHLQNRLLGDVEDQISNTPCNSLSDSSESLLSQLNPMQNEKLLRLFPPIPMIDGLPTVEIHIPSLGYSESQRQRIKRFDALQGRQIFRLFRATAPRKEVIYISPCDLSASVKSFYSDFIENIKGNDRYVEKIIIPQNIEEIRAEHATLSSLINEDILERIVSNTRGKNAYIVPGILCDYDLAIADFLKIPILGCFHSVHSQFRSKSEMRSIFQLSKVPTPPGFVQDNSKILNLYENLAALIVTNWEIERWLFKINTEHNGRGIAFCDVKKHLDCANYINESFRDTSTLTRKLVLREMPSVIWNNLQLADNEAYASVEEYLEVFLKEGGVIEASPASESITALTANILITPESSSTSSKISLVSVGDQIHVNNPFICWGFSYPQTSVHGPTLYKYLQDIGKQCLQANIVGYVSVDFVTFIDKIKMEQIVWAVDLDINYSDCMACSEILLASGLKFNLLGDSLRSGEDYGWTKERFAVISLQLHNSRFHGVNFFQFKQFCRYNDIILNKQAIFGSLIFPLSSNSLKYFGMVTINFSLKRALTVFSNNLAVLRKFNKSSKQEEKNNFREVTQRLQSISNLITENINDSQP